MIEYIKKRWRVLVIDEICPTKKEVKVVNEFAF